MLLSSLLIINISKLFLGSSCCCYSCSAVLLIKLLSSQIFFFRHGTDGHCLYRKKFAFSGGVLLNQLRFVGLSGMLCFSFSFFLIIGILWIIM